jgi:hypothetical protein
MSKNLFCVMQRLNTLFKRNCGEELVHTVPWCLSTKVFAETGGGVALARASFARSRCRHVRWTCSVQTCRCRCSPAGCIHTCCCATAHCSHNFANEECHSLVDIRTFAALQAWRRATHRKRRALCLRTCCVEKSDDVVALARALIVLVLLVQCTEARVLVLLVPKR